MSSSEEQEVANGTLGSYRVLVDKTADLKERQAVGIDIGEVTAGVLHTSRVSASNPMPVAGTFTPSGSANLAQETGGNLAALAGKDFATEATLDNIRDTVIATGASAQNVQGPIAAGVAVNAVNPMPVAFQGFPFGEAIVPTGLNASGVTVLGVVPLDLNLNIQDFSAAGEAFSLVAATANSSATARYITVDSSGAVLLQPLPAGSNTIGAVNLATPAQSTGWLKEYTASYSNTGTTNASARKIGGWIISNAHATSMAYVRIYDKATAATSSDTPIIKLALAPGAAANIELPHGIPLTDGFSVRATTGVADNNTTSPTANNVFGTILYV